MRALGLDVGSKTIGVAKSDELGWTAQGLTTIRRATLAADLQALTRLIHEHQIDTVVVGLPKNMDGTLGPQAQLVLSFVRALEKALPVPVVTWDERLSTIGAERALFEADLSRRKRRKVIDKMAAAFILQGYLDRSGGARG
ncbi:MAG: Holliday junction resolvase RuvX [Deltaproteobacteria bacterium]|nr:Holliday junction resolvase RuvX [Deltaproteobacteria bacterium]MBI3079521.1 Holliday junction resolvase RuvX [Deltaproteobacteria bacterium]